jgi:hypothetical protein
LNGKKWQEREHHLNLAYEIIAGKHNSLRITGPLETQVRTFHDRPFLIIDAGRFVEVIKSQITDPQVAAIESDIGSIDQFSHSTDLRAYPRLHKKLQSLYN